jgi:deoxyribodipyrimidine photolyase
MHCLESLCLMCISRAMQGLRMHDNRALNKAASLGSKGMYPVFCLDPHLISSGTIGSRRINFLLESLSDLDIRLREARSRLIVLLGNPVEVIPAVMKLWHASTLCYEKDMEPYALQRDAAVCKAVKRECLEVLPPTPNCQSSILCRVVWPSLPQ